MTPVLSRRDIYCVLRVINYYYLLLLQTQVWLSVVLYTYNIQMIAWGS